MNTKNINKEINGIFLLVIPTVITVTIKSFIETKEWYYLMITAGTLVVAIIIKILLNIYNVMYDRINKSSYSIAQQSATLIKELYAKAKASIRKGNWEKEEYKFVKKFDAISRHLLLLEDYDTRYKFGLLFYKNAKNPLIKMQMLVDELGWTSVMMGNHKAKHYLLTAIDLFNKELSIPKYLENGFEIHDEEQYKLLKLGIRAMRHLASSRLVNYPEQEVLLKRAIELYKIVFGVAPKFTKTDETNKLKSLEAGLYYGLCEVYLQKNKEEENEAALCELAETLMNSYEYAIKSQSLAIEAGDRFRDTKCILFLNEIAIRANQQKILDNESVLAEKYKLVFSRLRQIYVNEIPNNLKKINDAYKESLYVDEAFYEFLHQTIERKG